MNREAKVSQSAKQFVDLLQSVYSEAGGQLRGVTDFSGIPRTCGTAGTGVSRNLVTPTNNNAIELSFTESVFILSLAVLQN